MSMTTPKTLAAAAALAASLLGHAQAALVVTFQQAGADVTATVTGSLSTSAFRNEGPDSFDIHDPFFYWDTDRLALYFGDPGADSGSGSSKVVSLSVLSGTAPAAPAGFGGGALSVAGTFFEFDQADADNVFLRLPRGYVSGSAISTTATFSNTRLQDWGLADVSMVLTFGRNGHNDTLTFNVIDANPVPEPGSWALVAMAGLGVMLTRARARRA